MSKIIVNGKIFKSSKFENEAELEKVVVKNSKPIFGQKSVYFDIKKRVKSSSGNILSIPDGYVINFSEREPKLYIIENEISTHDAYRDIGSQLMRFGSSFKNGSIEIKNFLLEEIKKNHKISDEINELIKGRYNNFSELLDFVVFDNEYGFIVVIDEATEAVNSVLKQLANQPDVIEIGKYTSNTNEIIYQFSEFQEEIREALTKHVKAISDIDTIVCPANKEGFERVFIGENKWYAIRMSPSIIPQIKYIAMYETSPVSAIRWLGTVQSIKPYKDTGKFEVTISERKKITNPLKLTQDESKHGGIAPQGPRYSKLELIEKANKLSDIF